MIFYLPPKLSPQQNKNNPKQELRKVQTKVCEVNFFFNFVFTPLGRTYNNKTSSTNPSIPNVESRDSSQLCTGSFWGCSALLILGSVVFFLWIIYHLLYYFFPDTVDCNLETGDLEIYVTFLYQVSWESIQLKSAGVCLCVDMHKIALLNIKKLIWQMSHLQLILTTVTHLLLFSH